MGDGDGDHDDHCDGASDSRGDDLRLLLDREPLPKKMQMGFEYTGGGSE